MVAIDTIAEWVRRNGAVNTPAFFDALNAQNSKEGKLRYALEVAARTEAQAPMEANAIRCYLKNTGYEVTVADLCTNWFDQRENNGVVQITNDTPLLPHPRDGVTAPFVKNKIYDELARELGTDVSFSVIKRESTLINVRCVIFDNEINNSGLPITIIYGTQNIDLQLSALRTALRHLRLLRRVYCVPKIRLLVDEVMARACAHLAIEFDGVRNFVNIFTDLTLSEAAIWSQTRRSYRPLINKYRHRQAIITRTFDGVETFFKDKFCHDISMQYQKYMMINNAGALYTYYNENGQLSAIIGVTDIVTGLHHQLSCFNIGAFEKSEPGHYALYNTLRHLKEQNYRRFYLGLCSTEQAVSTKVGAINFFKTGFSTQVETYRVGVTSLS